MKNVSYASVTFDVGHSSPVPDYCRMQHGHPCTITVGLAGTPFRELGSFSGDVQDLVNQLALVQGELSRRNLNEMIAPANPTAAGLALWAWERMALRFGESLASVRVSLGSTSHEVTA